MCKSNRSLIPANDYSEIISLYPFVGMNGRLDLRIITQLYSEVYWGYFRRLVYENLLTKHNKLSSFSYSVVIYFIPHSHIPHCHHTKPPKFPRLFEPREAKFIHCISGYCEELSSKSALLVYFIVFHLVNWAPSSNIIYIWSPSVNVFK